ncbi:hypothetical protein NVI2019_GHJFPKLH_01574 [Providencia alcalifaciens]|nr:hypothetical protein NVI2019_GHJFPKLH_01574 [Providencia alcalifaciens]
MLASNQYVMLHEYKIEIIKPIIISIKIFYNSKIAIGVPTLLKKYNQLINNKNIISISINGYLYYSF